MRPQQACYERIQILNRCFQVHKKGFFMICPKCGSNIPDNTSICPVCKNDISDAFAYAKPKNGFSSEIKTRGKSKALPIAIAACVILFALAVALIVAIVVDKASVKETDALSSQNVEFTAKKSHEDYGKLTYEAVKYTDKIDKSNSTMPCGVICYEDSEKLWEYTEKVSIGLFEEMCEDILTDEKYVFTSIGENLIALDKFTGDIIWKTEGIGKIFSMVMDDNHLYIAGHEGYAVDVFHKDGTLIESDIKSFTGRIDFIEFRDSNTITVTYYPNYDGNETDTFTIDITEYKSATEPINPNSTGNLLIYPMSYDFLSPEGDIDYEADNVFDGNPKTVWSEGKSGIGNGAEIFFTVAGNKELSGLRILAGHNKTEALYYYNCRPSKIKIEDSHGNSESVSLADSYGEYQTVNFTKPMKGVVTITILDAYSGTVYQDTCISEITAF